ncbi:beta-ketoacyl-[acyl-carrier-protein] synthase family protein [Streptomyces brasiliensis]|uniref:3-oxoacyl-[acyl-carrier-protein] synthase 2 n=1 Tax=Streptomyces brasiliensis TaxID=1954 RepID=A0A917L800_9ACTN|nr:beta-ketoacyl-[acyl-carrier-protein] synthase family protein [Streptomyces brasiliensis]GGJ51348.1 3-oxoacyl-[acyl-carrier-protein] synthase 2 [Streptomyces brasiliensis]
MSDDRRRVMVTGIGLMTAIGQGAAPTWENLLEGRIGIGPLRAYDPAPLNTRIGAEIHDFDPTRWAKRRTLRMLCRGDQLALAGAVLALRDAGLEDAGDLGHRTGLFLGSNKEMPRMDELISQLQSVRCPDGTPDLHKLGRTASSVIAPLFFVEGLQPAAGFHISEKFGIRGANAYFAGTADSGAMAIGRAMRTVRRGEADVVVAGGYDDATGWWAMSKMDGIGVLSDRTDLGKEAFRPFDRDRSGSVFGEGAAFLILEEREHALARGARCYAEVTGFGSGNDCVRPPSPQPRARGLSRAISRALTDAGATFPDGSYIAAHGCATRQGDASETVALHDALGTAAKAAQISSVKPQTGHLVGGAGALNAAVAALSLDSGVVPATQNLHHPAEECDLDYVPLTARETRPGHALALARGLEGQAVAIALERTS